MYIKVEATRLAFFRTQQTRIRADLYQGIVDSVVSGETRGSHVGKRIVLPASFVGGPRDMRKRYLDVIALVAKYGKPDFFITMTCNPEWTEIQACLKPGQTSQDRPDVVARVFRAKIHDLKQQLFKNKIFGDVAAHVHVIEFQKRGLPHAHMLLIMKAGHKILDPDEFDRFVSAEIPDPVRYPELHQKVLKHMIHGPCGEKNPKNPCMQNDECRNYYPRQFAEETTQGKDSYPIYRRRNDGREVVVRNTLLDNRWVVPYNPYLLSRYDCHINVEICSGIKAVKYLYKYIYKGHDKVEVQIHPNDGTILIDEIQQYQDARWVAAPEAIWRIYGFNLNEISPAVINLQLHLPNKQSVSYWETQDLTKLLKSHYSSQTMLTEFFTYCLKDKDKQPYLYANFPETHVWEQANRCWRKRKHKQVIGRLNSASPAEGERYFLRLLLNHVHSPTSFEDLLTYNDTQHKTFKEAAESRGLLLTDTWIFDSLREATTFQMPCALRHLFATLLVFCQPQNVRGLWDAYYDDLAEDYNKKKTIDLSARLNMTLASIASFLDCMGRKISEFELPSYEGNVGLDDDGAPREVTDELAVETPNTDLSAVGNLNTEQREAYDCILQHVYDEKGQAFFVDGPGGTGKTFLYRALLATVRSSGKLALATATSGVAASILPGGRTAHSRFKIAIDGDEGGVCGVTKQSGTAQLLKMASLIIWDEAPMAKRWDVEAVDRTLRDIMQCELIFGGKVVVLGGDFRQVLPVIPRASRAESINASLSRSFLWPKFHRLSLSQNMRAISDPAFGEFLIRVGNGTEPTTGNSLIAIPPRMVIECANEETPADCIIRTIYSELHTNGHCPQYITERAILAARNEWVDMLNSKLIALFPGEHHRYVSYDKAIDDGGTYYPEEFLNTLTPNGLPPHNLILKVNSPIMLLRNISPSEGLCNGTRMICRDFTNNIIHAMIAVGQHAGKHVFLHRIPLYPPKNEGFPFQFQRMQFPIRLCFAMTINKAQGQTIPTVGVYLPKPVFSHGQLYVALSRGISMDSTKVYVEQRNPKHADCPRTKNIVHQEVLSA